MPRTSSTELAERLMELIPLFMSRIRNDVRAANPLRLSVPQYRILGDLQSGRCLTGEIARREGVSRAAVSVMIDTLVRKQLVLRTARPDDRRKIHLQLTPEGEALYLEVGRSVHGRLERTARRLRARDRKQLLEGLRQLEQLLELHGAVSVRPVPVYTRRGPGTNPVSAHGGSA